MTLRRKLGLCALLGLGLLAAVAGIVKVNYLAGLNARSDLTCKAPLTRIVGETHNAQGRRTTCSPGPVPSSS